MDNIEKTSFTSLLAQLDSRNKRIKDLERQLDNYFIVSQKYFKLRQTLREIKQIVEQNQKDYLVNNRVILLCNRIFDKISEVSDDMENN